jgi:hypothetical protein
MMLMEERRAITAGDQDHSIPSRFRGEPADKPTDVGLPPASDTDPDDSDHGDVATSPWSVHPAAVAGWRNCRASNTLLAAVNRRWPMRETARDGTLGDPHHPSDRSDHHPWLFLGTRVVRARDFDANGIDAAWLAEHLRRLGAAGDPRLYGGYVIFNERITSADWRTWRRYTGADPHTTHLHVSFSRSGFDNPSPWLLLEDDTVTPQDLRAIVNGVLDTQVPLRSSGKGGYTSLRQVITQLQRAIVPVGAEECRLTYDLVQQVSTEVAAVRDALAQLALASTPPTDAETGNRGDQ